MDLSTATRLIDIWTEWLATYERTIGNLHEQTAAMLLRDLDKLQQVRMLASEGIEELRFLDRIALEALGELGADLGATPDVRVISKSLPKDVGEKLHAVANHVAVSARYLAAIQQKNAALAAA